jgi:DNA-binding cell septation regulator SpoVG
MEEAMGVPEVRIRSWVRASEADIRSGLYGFLSLFFGNLVVDGVTLRRTAAGRFALSFPVRTSRSGERHALVRPVDDDARRAIERMVFAELGQRDGIGAAKEGDHA